MEALLMREQSPLTAEEWTRLDEMAVQAARRLLVGRRFLPLYGPVGIGVQVTPLDTLSWSPGCVHYDLTSDCSEGQCSCEGECEPITVTKREFVSLPILHKDFCLAWRDIAAARQFNTPLDLSAAAAAGAAVAWAEDQFIFSGNEDKGFPGLLSASGDHLGLGNWGDPGAIFGSVTAARAALVQDGFLGPYALVLSPDLYSTVQRILPNTGRLEVQFLADLATLGVFQTPALGAKKALLISATPENLDLVVAQDLSTAYLGPAGMDHPFRVFESLALRLKRSGAIRILEG